MDRNSTIERWRVPLLGIIAKLFAEIGLTEGGTVERVSKPLHRFILGKLRTAESAVRRLILAAARDIVVEYKPPRERPALVKPRTSSKDKSKAAVEGEAKPKRKRGFLFNLFDPPKRSKKFFRRPVKRPPVVPRVTIIDLGYDRGHPTIRLFEPPPAVPAPIVEEKIDDGMVNAKHLVRRLLAVMDALQDIQRHAMRLAPLAGQAQRRAPA